MKDLLIIFAFLPLIGFGQVVKVEFEAGTSLELLEARTDDFQVGRGPVVDGHLMGAHARLRLLIFYIEASALRGRISRDNGFGQFYDSDPVIFEGTLGLVIWPDWTFGVMSDVSWMVYAGYKRGYATSIAISHLTPPPNLINPEDIAFGSDIHGFEFGFRVDHNREWHRAIPNFELGITYRRFENDLALDNIPTPQISGFDLPKHDAIIGLELKFTWDIAEN